MKSTDAFKNTISQHLEARAKTDELFSATFAKKEKNIDDCINYILNTVQKSGCNGFTDDEIFGMAAHYYDEENIEVGKPVNARVVVNHQTSNKTPVASQPKPTPTQKRKETKQPAPYIQHSLFD